MSHREPLKTITAARRSKLVEAGKLDLNDRAFSLLNLPPPLLAVL